MTWTDAEVRANLLIEILQEEAEEQGVEVPPPPPEAKSWSEAAIREYFRSGGAIAPPPSSPLPRIPPSDPATFQKWFPGLQLSGTALDSPKLRVLCFPNAGSAEDMYTLEGRGRGRPPAPCCRTPPFPWSNLQDWCRAHGAEVLAVQPTGRNMRGKETPVTSCRGLAGEVLQVVGSRLYDVPYVIVAHSVGTWVAYEFMCLCRKAGVPLPRQAFLSGFAAPDLPQGERPWRQQRGLGEVEFKEECRGWDVNEIVFSGAMWATYQPLMRADFTLFDEYDFIHQGEPPFSFPIHSFFGTRDKRITEKMVQGWERFTSGSFRCQAVEGNHLWPLDKEAKRKWLQAIADQLGELC